ncbi:hypothetical protein PQU94_08755 [Asticcacaulis sp. DXS10W]|uniref:Uncharacterized protein n=1 Tax=Asticcacaulis currens TaxID=2984210 RepID=A0ABT5IDW2_9CAUL|nr:hypothetical protein [Asticcacaulis currens]MDC7694370.1 hypothetical protein [Asticcacaulis currens]
MRKPRTQKSKTSHDESQSRIVYLDDVPSLPPEAQATLEQLVSDMSRQLSGVYDQCRDMKERHGVSSEAELLTISHALAQFREGFRGLLLRSLNAEGADPHPAQPDRPV